MSSFVQVKLRSQASFQTVRFDGEAIVASDLELRVRQQYKFNEEDVISLFWMRDGREEDEISPGEYLRHQSRVIVLRRPGKSGSYGRIQKAKVYTRDADGRQTVMAPTKNYLEHEMPKVKRPVGIPSEMLVRAAKGEGDGFAQGEAGAMMVLRSDDASFARAMGLNVEKALDLDREGAPVELSCPICKLAFKDVVLVPCCGQSFCRECISTETERNTLCPLCRSEEFTPFLANRQMSLLVRQWLENKQHQGGSRADPGDRRRQSGGPLRSLRPQDRAAAAALPQREEQARSRSAIVIPTRFSRRKDKKQHLQPSPPQQGRRFQEKTGSRHGATEPPAKRRPEPPRSRPSWNPQLPKIATERRSW